MRIRKYLIWGTVILLILAGISWSAFTLGKRAVIKEFESMQVDSTIMKRVDSLFHIMLVRLDTSSTRREIIYRNTETIYNKIIESYEKADTLRPYIDRDSLLQSLTRISNTKF